MMYTKVGSIQKFLMNEALITLPSYYAYTVSTHIALSRVSFLFFFNFALPGAFGNRSLFKFELVIASEVIEQLF